MKVLIYIQWIVTSSRVISTERSSFDYERIDITENVMNKNVCKFLMMLPTSLFLEKQIKDEVTILVPDQQWRTANEKVPPQTTTLGGKYNVVSLFSKHSTC